MKISARNVLKGKVKSVVEAGHGDRIWQSRGTGVALAARRLPCRHDLRRAGCITPFGPAAAERADQRDARQHLLLAYHQATTLDLQTGALRIHQLQGRQQRRSLCFFDLVDAQRTGGPFSDAGSGRIDCRA